MLAMVGGVEACRSSCRKYMLARHAAATQHTARQTTKKIKEQQQGNISTQARAYRHDIHMACKRGVDSVAHDQQHVARPPEQLILIV
jgi:hypothetical protein